MNHIADRFPQGISINRVDRDEDGYPDTQEVETLKCECGQEFPLHELQLVDDGTDTPLFLCPLCVVEFYAQEEEPVCACEVKGSTWCWSHGAILRMVGASALTPTPIAQRPVLSQAAAHTQNHSAEVA